MKNLLHDDKTKTEEDLELERRIEEELRGLQYDENDFCERNTDRDDVSEYQALIRGKNNLEDSFSASVDFNNEAWREYYAARDENKKEEAKMENAINKMALANQNKLFVLDYENLEEKPLELNNQLFSQDKNVEIKEKIQHNLISEGDEIEENKLIRDIIKKSVDLEKRDLERARQLEVEKAINSPINVQNPTPRSRENIIHPKNNRETEIALRLERAQIERELMNMEREDELSREYEIMAHRNRFNQRLINLPDAFPNYKEEPSALTKTGLKFWIPTFQTPIITTPIVNPLEHLLETTKAKLDGKELNKIVNKKKHIIKFHKMGQKENLLLQKKGKLENDTLNNQINEVKSLNKSSSLLKPLKSIDSTPSVGHVCSSSTEIYLQKIIQIHNMNIKNSITQKVSNTLNSTLNTIDNLKSSHSYNFFFKGEDEPDNQELFLGDSNQQKSLEVFISNIPKKDYPKQIKLELKMENICDLKGLEEMKYTRFLLLSMNKIKETNNINMIKNLVELNLAQNELHSMKGISELKNLRFLNLEVNHLTKIEDLKGCINLEILNLNNNQLTSIDNLGELKKLKKLFLFRNKITKMTGLDELVNLEELDIGRNMITEIEGIQNCVLLRKLILYFNQISKVPKKFSHTCLSELWLNGNKLQDISNLGYLPSLEHLNCQENQITDVVGDSFMFIPNIKKLNLSFNKINSFAQIHKLLMKTTLLEEFQINENPLFHEITSTTKEFYDNSLGESLTFLKDFNNSKFRYDHESNNKPNCDKPDKGYHHFSQLSRYLDDYHYLDKIGSNKFGQNRFSFHFQRALSISKIVDGPSGLLKIATVNNTNNSPILIKHRFCYDVFMADLNYKLSLYKIKSFLLRLAHKKRKIRKYYQNNLKKVIIIQALTRGYLVRKVTDTRKVFKEKQRKKQFLTVAPFAIKIQKVFRGYRLRKKMRERFSNISYNVGEFEEVDLGFFDQGPQLDKYDLKLREDIDLAQFVMAVSQPSTNYNTVKGQKTHPETNGNHFSPDISNIEEEKDENGEDDDQYSVSSMKTGKSVMSIRLKENRPVVNKTAQAKAEYMKIATDEWKFENEQTKELFALRLAKKHKHHEKKKTLSAFERLEAFQKIASKK